MDVDRLVSGDPMTLLCWTYTGKKFVHFSNTMSYGITNSNLHISKLKLTEGTTEKYLNGKKNRGHQEAKKNGCITQL